LFNTIARSLGHPATLCGLVLLTRFDNHTFCSISA